MAFLSPVLIWLHYNQKKTKSNKNIFYNSIMD
ncbi:hypothetical protein [Caudoviricetes sp.]|nr:hypothetical protein [Caudoviricetes sp.]